MFIKRERYEALIKAEERGIWLLARVNQLEQAAAHERFQATGVPQIAPEIKVMGNRPMTPKPARAEAMVDSMHGKSLGEAMAALNGFSFEDSDENEITQ
jgi:hypothetical protein